MNFLFIDTSSSYVTISILNEDKILYLFQEQILSDMASRIMPIISEALNSLNISIKDIDKVFVVNGPGSFTGIRVGVTVAKTIAWSLNKKIIPISSLELLASTSTLKKYIVPMIDARRGNVYSGVYDNNLNCIEKDTLINLTDLINDKHADYEFVSNDKLCINNDVKKPIINVAKIILKHINDNGVNPHNLNPNYLKLTEAEENRTKND